MAKLLCVTKNFKAARLVAMACACLSLPAVASELKSVTIIGGRVTDHLNKPVAHAVVNLRDNESGAAQSDRTDNRGAFEFYNPRCQSCSLEVDPPDKAGLAMAMIDYFPGNRTRQFSVHLQPGFNVKGTVTHGGKGLKGIFVLAEPADASKSGDPVHGGGYTLTAGNGSYHLILTPGSKKVTFKNNRYKDLPGEFQGTLEITADKDHVDFEIPKK